MKRLLIRFALALLIIEVALWVLLAIVGIHFADL